MTLNPSNNAIFNHEDSIDRDNTAIDNDEHSDLASESQLQLDQDVDHHAIMKPSIETIGHQLAAIMGQSPFVAHTFTRFHYEDGKMCGKVDANPALIGNPNFQILHGGMTATLLKYHWRA